MKVNFEGNISFKSRNPLLRKADDIQRRTRAQFPMLSSTYAFHFYDSTMKNEDEYYNKLDFLNEKIRSQRLKTKNEDNAFIAYVKSLKNIKKTGVGNCLESSIALISALCANGFTNATKAHLLYVVDFTDKKTGKVKTGKYPVDHTFVVTDMNKGKGRNIVLDSWFGLAATKDKAMTEYKRLLLMFDTQKLTVWAYCNAFKKLLVPKYEKIIKKYDIKPHLDILEYNDLTKYDIKNLQKYSKENYPNLLV